MIWRNSDTDRRVSRTGYDLGKNLLQKAIRRGHHEDALRAAWLITSVKDDTIAARLPAIACENIGLGNLDLLNWCYGPNTMEAARSYQGERRAQPWFKLEPRVFES